MLRGYQGWMCDNEGSPSIGIDDISWEEFKVAADELERLSARVAELEGVMNMIETEISSAETWNPSIFNLVRQALTPPMEDKP